MAYGIGDIVAKATNSLPLPRLGRWEIQVKNEDKYTPPSDNALVGAIRKGFHIIDTIKEATQDFFSSLAGDSQAFNYTSIADFDSFIECSIQKDSQVTNRPVERGSFRSVNKVQKPTIAKVVLAKGGFYKGIETCLEALNDLQGSTKLCRVVTPFGVTKDMNLFKFNHSYKKETGSHMLMANLELIEIREGIVRQKSLLNVKNPVDSDLVDTGVKSLKEAGSAWVSSVKSSWS